MTRKTLLIAIAILAVLAILVTIASRRQDGSEKTLSESAPTVTAAPEEAAEASETLTADLFFPDTGGWLLAERREVPVSSEPAERISAVVANLLAGPAGGGGMRAPLPEGVGVRKVYLSDDGVALLDLESAEALPPASGSLAEMLTVYSLVNTVLLNFEELDRVVLLWNGRQLRTFAGHLDTMRPLTANTDLIAREAGRASGTAP